ncbi:MAG: 4Fe-4S binding protein [Candidatus Coatesbacteria bacterium]|nr:4Fe-4S binding protein [Candidatus Coatesbacteria bacterium]
MPEVKATGRVVIDKDLCKGCELCIGACPKGVLAMSTKINAKGYFYSEAVNPDDCIGCALCAMSCPDVAIEVYK